MELVEPDTLLFLRAEGVSLIARMVRDGSDLNAGSTVHVDIPPKHRHWFDATSGERIRSGSSG